MIYDLSVLSLNSCIHTHIYINIHLLLCSLMFRLTRYILVTSVWLDIVCLPSNTCECVLRICDSLNLYLSCKNILHDIRYDIEKVQALLSFVSEDVKNKTSLLQVATITRPVTNLQENIDQ